MKGNITQKAIESLVPPYQALQDALASHHQPAPSVQRLEMHLANCLNLARESGGLPRLKFDRMLSAIARGHSAEMCGLGYFAHESPTPGLQTPQQRYIAGFNKSPRFLAKNVYHSGSSERRRLALALADSAHEGLMNSPGHCANILASGATHLGVGIVASENGSIWITEMFSSP